MRRSNKKSFDWYGTKQQFSIRKYHFGAASVFAWCVVSFRCWCTGC
ncbi:YSIRK-type signal peptide-containing protein [Streptococcus suis]